ncbi:unnamed protein product [Moneuplotes crassus]|uniref:Uncharacterized protein n=1 Tax=Euplotes crassus TaxID=5936 RepID=A0AAD1X7H7_EUPCR|nr:unnamed protein product [Moneuplotes crassus]
MEPANKKLTNMVIPLLPYSVALNILPYYGYWYDWRFLMSNLSKKTWCNWKDNKKAFTNLASKHPLKVVEFDCLSEEVVGYLTHSEKANNKALISLTIRLPEEFEIFQKYYEPKDEDHEGSLKNRIFKLKLIFTEYSWSINLMPKLEYDKYSSHDHQTDKFTQDKGELETLSYYSPELDYFLKDFRAIHLSTEHRYGDCYGFYLNFRELYYTSFLKSLSTTRNFMLGISCMKYIYRSSFTIPESLRATATGVVMEMYEPTPANINNCLKIFEEQKCNIQRMEIQLQRFKFEKVKYFIKESFGVSEKHLKSAKDPKKTFSLDTAFGAIFYAETLPVDTQGDSLTRGSTHVVFECPIGSKFRFMKIMADKISVSTRNTKALSNFGKKIENMHHDQYICIQDLSSLELRNYTPAQEVDFSQDIEFREYLQKFMPVLGKKKKGDKSPLHFNYVVIQTTDVSKLFMKVSPRLCKVLIPCQILSLKVHCTSKLELRKAFEYINAIPESQKVALTLNYFSFIPDISEVYQLLRLCLSKTLVYLDLLLYATDKVIKEILSNGLMSQKELDYVKLVIPKCECTYINIKEENSLENVIANFTESEETCTPSRFTKKTLCSVNYYS